MSWPASTRALHQQFCEIEDRDIVCRSDGSPVGHHLTYEKTLLDGSIFRTTVSRPPNKTTYGKQIRSHIFRDQLCVNEEIFLACVNDGIVPDRGERRMPPESIPVELVFLLKNRVHLSEAEIAGLMKAEAIERVNRLWRDGPEE